jgi:hypothetical protein
VLSETHLWRLCALTYVQPPIATALTRHSRQLNYVDPVRHDVMVPRWTSTPLHQIEDLLERLMSAARDCDRSRVRTLAGLRLAGDLRRNVSARPAAAGARRHLTELSVAAGQLRQLHRMASTMTAPVAITAWEANAQRSLRHVDALVQSTNEVVGTLASLRPM